MKNGQKSNRIVAVIDIGSHLIKMRVSQLYKGDVKDIDKLEYPIEIGQEVFENKSLSFETISKIIEILRGYSHVMEEYGVIEYRLIAGTVLKHALNSAYLIDQVKIHTDMKLEIIPDCEKKTLLYHDISRLLAEKFPSIQDAVITFLGSFNIGFATIQQQSVIISQDINVGSVETSNLLTGLQGKATDFAGVLSEFLESNSGSFIKDLSNNKSDTFIISGNYIKIIAEMCKADLVDKIYSTTATDIISLYKHISKMTIQTICEKYSLSYDQSILLYCSLAIYTYILQHTKATKVKIIEIDIWDVFVRFLLLPKSNNEFYKTIRENSLKCAKYFASRYNCNKDHYETVLNYACTIFDKVKKTQSLSSRHKLVLKIACILHECGLYVDTTNHIDATFQIIKSLNIYGLSNKEIIDVAKIASCGSPSYSSFKEFKEIEMDDKQSLYISKLIAILRLSNTLDESKKQKITSLKLKLKLGTLIFTVSSNQDLYLERWAFQNSAEYFYKVMGMPVKFEIKSLLF